MDHHFLEEGGWEISNKKFMHSKTFWKKILQGKPWQKNFKEDLSGIIKAKTHDATNRGDTSRQQVASSALLPRQGFGLIWSLRYVARIQISLNLCDRSQRQNSVAVTMIFTCHIRWFVAATCRCDVLQRFVASCVSAFSLIFDITKILAQAFAQQCTT